MRALVTGSTGLLGNNLVRTLIDAGHEVWALARSKEKAQRELSDTAARVVLGDIRNVANFVYELRGIDVIFHTATHTVSPNSATLADTVSWAQKRVQRKSGRSAPALSVSKQESV